MHPFGMPSILDTVPYPPARAGAEVMDWIAAEQAELADVELPEGPDDFELSIAAWLRYVRKPFRLFVWAWVAAIGKQASVPLSASSMKKLRGMMRRDVDESAGMLWDASPEVIAAWVGWYPEWIEGLIAERGASDPWFLLPAEQFHRAKQSRQTHEDTIQKQAKRDREIGARLFEHVESHGGMVRWRPGLLAEKISAKGGGKRVDGSKVAEMGAALVRIDVAQWRKRTDGRVWAFQLTGLALEPPKDTKRHLH